MDEHDVNFSWDVTHECYLKRHRLSNNQCCLITFYRDYGTNGAEYQVGFAVGDKRKDVDAYLLGGNDARRIDCKTVGTCGLEALVWARQTILEFETYVKKPAKIIIFGADNKRLRVYERAMKRHGYHKCMYLGRWCVMKKLERSME